VKSMRKCRSVIFEDSIGVRQGKDVDDGVVGELIVTIHHEFSPVWRILVSDLWCYTSNIKSFDLPFSVLFGPLEIAEVYHSNYDVEAPFGISNREEVDISSTGSGASCHTRYT
jgi:hypothetical protein